LALMFVPLYGLFELGLAGMGWVERPLRESDERTVGSGPL
jgi:Sec-independent protein secretion pathway component TatC